jgi:carboxypeptidase family protein/TonB-dependent receptor-like protein
MNGGKGRITAVISVGFSKQFERAKKIVAYVACFAVALLALSPTMCAQRLDGTLRVIVADASGASVVDATVSVVNESTNVGLTTTASSEGTYEFPNLLIGGYRVTVEKEGFKKYVGKNVAVTASQVSDVKVTLEIGAASVVVEVNSAGDLIKTTSSELASSLDGRVVNEIPITVPGGSVLEYATLAPNSTTQPGGSSGGSGGSIGGLRPRFNSFTIDGADDNNQGVNGPNQPVIQDSVAEFTLLTNQFSAEYGHSGGGQFIITTKSGTNAFHGEAHEYNQNKDFFAEDNLQKLNGEKQRFDYNRAGASIGGPIKKDKLFFFGAYEFQNNGLAAGSPVITAPTAAGLAQISSEVHPDAAIQAILAQTPVAATSNGLAHCNSGASDPTPDFACVTTASGRIPIDVGSLQAIAPSFSNQDDFITNADLTLGAHQIRARFLYNRFRSPSLNPSQPQAQFNGTTAVDARKVILGDAWTINSRLISDFRLQYSRINGPNSLAPPAFANFPNAEVDELGISDGPNPSAPQGYTQNTYQLVETLTYIRGKHTLRVGGEVRKYIDKTIFLPRARAEWDWATLNSFLNDYVPDGADGALRNVGNGTFVGNDNALMAFMQDDFKITPRLTLNLGLRYEYFGVPRDANEQAENAISDDPAMGLYFKAPKPDTNNFGPRIGFAYDPLGNAKWSIRGGAGYYYDIYPTNFETNTQPPQIQFENNPNLTCEVAPSTPWCASFLNPADGTGKGFLLGGGLSPFITPTNQALARALTAGIVPNLTSPKILSWTLSVQHQIQKDTSIEVRYLGTHAVSLPAQIRLNEASAFDPNIPGGGLKPLPTYFSNSAVPASLPTTSQTLADFQNFINNGLYAPYSADGFFGVLTDEAPAAQSLYHSGSVDMIHRFAGGLYLRANFTFSKTIDDATNELDSSTIDPRRPLDARDLSLDRGRSALDFNRKGTISWVYDLPKFAPDNAVAKAFLNGWEVSGSYLAETGAPVTLLNGTDANANGSSTADRPSFNPAGTSNVPSGFNYVCINGTGVTSIVSDFTICPLQAASVVGYVAANPASKYVQAGLGSNTNIVGRDTIDTPGLNLWNIAVIKSTRIGERVNLQIRAETYNTFNHRNYSIGLPSNNGGLDSATNANPFDAGLVLVTAPQSFLNFTQLSGGNRTMQLGLKIIF